MSDNVPSFEFPHADLTPLPSNTEPDYAFVRILKKQVYANAVSVHSNIGGGNHGHLGEIVSAAQYATLTGGAAAYVTPNNPGQEPVFGENDTGPQRILQTEAWKRDKERFHTAASFRSAIKKQIFKAVPARFFAALEDDLMGYANVTPLAMLTHLETTYGVMTPADHEANKAKLKESWDPNTTTIADLWNRFKTVCDIARSAGNPISDMDKINAAREVIEQTGQFASDVSKWMKKPPADWTWPNFITHFEAANKERMRLRTAGQLGYAQAAKAQKKPEETTPSATTKPEGTAPTALQATAGKENAAPKGTQMYYCWSHGLGFNKNHTSATCENPKEGHQKEATLANMMGGSARIRRKKGDKAHDNFKVERNQDF